MQDVDAGWLMTSLSSMGALVQAAKTLPMFLLSIPAGPPARANGLRGPVAPTVAFAHDKSAESRRAARLLSMAGATVMAISWPGLESRRHPDYRQQ